MSENRFDMYLVYTDGRTELCMFAPRVPRRVYTHPEMEPKTYTGNMGLLWDVVRHEQVKGLTHTTAHLLDHDLAAADVLCEQYTHRGADKFFAERGIDVTATLLLIELSGGAVDWTTVPPSDTDNPTAKCTPFTNTSDCAIVDT